MLILWAVNMNLWSDHFVAMATRAKLPSLSMNMVLPRCVRLPFLLVDSATRDSYGSNWQLAGVIKCWAPLATCIGCRYYLHSHVMNQICNWNHFD